MQISLLTIGWYTAMTACWTLTLMHLLIWQKNQQTYVYLLSTLMAASAGTSAMLELIMLFTESLEKYRVLIRLENIAIYFNPCRVH